MEDRGLAEHETCDDAGGDDREGHRVGVGTEPGDQHDQLVQHVATSTVECTDEEDVGAVEARQRRVNVPRSVR